MSSCCAIFNPNAGSADEAEAFEAAARSRGDVDFCKTQAAGDGAKLAEERARDGCPLVLAAGGDGTVSEVVTGLMRAREGGVDPLPALLIVPLGTGNDLARTFDLPEEPTAVLPLLDDGERVPMDVMKWSLQGTVEDGPSAGWAINVIAGGFSSKLQAALTKDIKKTWGPLAYLRAGAATADELEKPHRLAISIDDGRPQMFEAVNVIVANARFAGGGIAVAPMADPGDAQLNLVAITPGEDTLDLAGVAASLFSGEVHQSEHVINVPGRKFVIEATPPLPFNVDGDKLGHGTMTVECIPAALQILRPRRASGA